MSKFITCLEVHENSFMQYRLGVVGTAPVPLVRWTYCIREMRRKGKSDIIRTWAWHTTVAGCPHDMASPDAYITFGKPSNSFFSLTPWAFWLADVRTEATVEPTILYQWDGSHGLALAVGFNLKIWMKVVVPRLDSHQAKKDLNLSGRTTGTEVGGNKGLGWYQPFECRSRAKCWGEKNP